MLNLKDPDEKGASLVITNQLLPPGRMLVSPEYRRFSSFWQLIVSRIFFPVNSSSFGRGLGPPL